MDYYKTNAIYENLDGSEDYYWVVGNAWILVYGDHGSNPKLIVFAHGKSWQVDQNIIHIVSNLSKETGIPAIRIEFEDSSSEIDSVDIHKGSGEKITVGLDSLKYLYQKYGVPVNNKPCQKSVNDATSSAYHNWQRASLGSITVSDIDLFYLGRNREKSIIELKRSYIPLENWSPYRDDFPNFMLLSNLCSSGGYDFLISYNVRHKSPFRDDPSIIKLFYYDDAFQSQGTITLNFEEFASAKY